MEIKKKEEEANDQTGLYIGIGVAVLLAIGGRIYYKKNKKSDK